MKKTSELFSETTEALISYRQRTYVALQTCLRRITAALLLTGTQEMLQLHTIDPDNRGPHTEKQQLLWSMRSLRWGDLLSEYCRVSAERLCALLRLRADQLDRLSFQNPGDREAFKRRWEEERCDSHASTDEQNVMIGHISRMAWATVIQVERNNFRYKAVKWRLLTSFDCFDTAWKRAEKRVSDEELDMYEVSLQEISDEEVCIICQSDICLDSAVVIRLRCSHMFIALV